MPGTPATMVRPTQERAMLSSLVTTRSPARDRVMVLGSMQAGQRATALAALPWAMVTEAHGQVAEVLHVPWRARKGTTGGRPIPLHPDLQAALGLLQPASRTTPSRQGGHGHGPRAQGGAIAGPHLPSRRTYSSSIYYTSRNYSNQFAIIQVTHGHGPPRDEGTRLLGAGPGAGGLRAYGS